LGTLAGKVMNRVLGWAGVGEGEEATLARVARDNLSEEVRPTFRPE